VKQKLLLFICIFIAISTTAVPLEAYFPFEIFTDNGSYSDGSGLNLYFNVSQVDTFEAEFTFYNDSLTRSSMSGIYFNFGSPEDVIGFTNGPGTSFETGATPGHLPACNNLEPPFDDAELYPAFGSASPRYGNGINPADPAEWLKVNLDISNTSNFSGLVDGLQNNEYRIGIHLIGLPDGSSEMAVSTPEPATIMLMGFGGLALARRKKK